VALEDPVTKRDWAADECVPRSRATIGIDFSVTNFFIDKERVGSSPAIRGRGHFHLFFDEVNESNYIGLTAEDPFVPTFTAAKLNSLALGRHTLVAALANTNHTLYEPRVENVSLPFILAERCRD